MSYCVCLISFVTAIVLYLREVIHLLRHLPYSLTSNCMCVHPIITSNQPSFRFVPSAINEWVFILQWADAKSTMDSNAQHTTRTISHQNIRSKNASHLHLLTLLPLTQTPLQCWNQTAKLQSVVSETWQLQGLQLHNLYKLCSSSKVM